MSYFREAYGFYKALGHPFPAGKVAWEVFDAYVIPRLTKLNVRRVYKD
jgi:hypothetical protein